MPEKRPQIVYVTDRGLLRPTLLSLWSLLEHISAVPDVHFWGDGLSEVEWNMVRRVAATHPQSRLFQRQIDPADLAGCKTPADYISAATMGRLFIPRHLHGYVLYIDGDTLVTGDVAPLFNLDLGGNCLGAVRDYVVALWAIEKDGPEDHRRRLASIATHMQPKEYFNAGVLLMNCDAIRSDNDLLQQTEDVMAASALEWGDQDHLNFIFSDRVTLLNPAYNSSWARAGRQRRFATELGGLAEETKSVPDVIRHFHGPRKPWKKPRYDLWSRRARAVMSYRRQMRRFHAEFPDLAP